jgi:hypothetical protein
MPLLKNGSMTKERHRCNAIVLGHSSTTQQLLVSGILVQCCLELHSYLQNMYSSLLHGASPDMRAEVRDHNGLSPCTQNELLDYDLPQ